MGDHTDFPRPAALPHCALQRGGDRSRIDSGLGGLHHGWARRTNAPCVNAADGDALYQQLSVPQHDGLIDRLRRAVGHGQIKPDADLDGIANAPVND